MIYHASYPSAQSVAQPAEGVPAIPGLNPYHQRGIPAAFRLPDDGSQPDDKEDREEHQDGNIEEQTGLTTGTPEIFRLLLDTDFRMMFEFFMTPGQRDMLEIRSVIRENLHSLLVAMVPIQQISGPLSITLTTPSTACPSGSTTSALPSPR